MLCYTEVRCGSSSLTTRFVFGLQFGITPVIPLHDRTQCSTRSSRHAREGMQSVLTLEVRWFAQRFTPAAARTLNRRPMASALRNETPEQRKARKEEVKAQKADKRARREGHIPDDYGQKSCSICKQQKDLLIR